jgi:acyl-CoA reductase-like NAD-dependent aldehyde dehydrogenase
MIPFLCELGGKDPMIVLDDADLRAAAKWAVWGGAVFNAGQSCVAVERIYVVEKVYDQFVDLIVQEASKITMGYSPAKENPYHMGPLTFQRQVDIIGDHLKDALTKGAHVAYGGNRDGMFMEPTVLVDVDHSMKVMREETFGPLLPVMKVSDEVHAIQLANHSDFGLSAYVWGGNIERAKRVGAQLEVGSVMINDVLVHYITSLLPFGGVKLSGNARKHGKEEVLQYTQLHATSVGPPPLPFDVSTILRYPNHYRLGAAVMRLAFGVTLRQRLQPFAELLDATAKPTSKNKVLTALGALMAVFVAVVGLLLNRKSRKANRSSLI